MSILDLTEHPAWYAVRVALHRYGNSGPLGLSYQWEQPKFLGNMDALKYVVGLNARTSHRGGMTTFYEAELFQWDGSRWTHVA